MTQLGDALRQWQQGDQDGAVRALTPLAEDDDGAAMMLAWMLQQRGALGESIDVAARAAELGAGWVAWNYASTLLQSQSSTEFEGGLDLFRRALAIGWPVDPSGNIMQLATSNRDAELERVIDVIRHSPWPYHEQVARADELVDEIRSAAREVGRARDQAKGDMDQDVLAIQTERERIETDAAEVLGLVSKAAAGHQAAEYAKFATDSFDSARVWTGWAIGVLAFAAVGSAVIAIWVLSGDHTAGSVLSKAALTLPLYIIAGYLGAIAGQNRKMGWHWRHVELQLKTAQPFITPLGDDLRERTLGELALRFFPGQALDPQGKGDAVAPPSAAGLALGIADDMQRQRQAASSAQSPPA